MNLAAQGLEGKIAEAIPYYRGEHNMAGKRDFVMANPPSTATSSTLSASSAIRAFPSACRARGLRCMR
jgi:hypothetical protein